MGWVAPTAAHQAGKQLLSLGTLVNLSQRFCLLLSEKKKKKSLPNQNEKDITRTFKEN